MSENETTDTDDEADDETSVASSFAFTLGLGLAVVAVGWAFFGPAALLETGRYELPVLASFREPFQTMFFAYIGAVTFGFAFLGSIALPSMRDVESESYETDFAISLVLPAAGVTVLMIVLGLLFPALFYLVNGELVRAGLVLGMALVIVVAALIYDVLGFLILGIVSIPLWLPSFVGAYAGGFLQKTIAN